MFESLRNRKHYYIGEELRRHYAVMIPLVEHEGQICVVFEVRSADIERQPGEICLPGGGRENDESSKETAVRETCEELLVKREQIDVICEMDTLLNERREEVHVYLGKINDYAGTFSADEVAEVFMVPLDWFIENDPDIYTCHTLYEFPEDFPFEKLPGGKDYKWRSPDRDVYFYTWNGRVIWGLTGRVMSSAAQIIRIEAAQNL